MLYLYYIHILHIHFPILRKIDFVHIQGSFRQPPKPIKRASFVIAPVSTLDCLQAAYRGGSECKLSAFKSVHPLLPTCQILTCGYASAFTLCIHLRAAWGGCRHNTMLDGSQCPSEQSIIALPFELILYCVDLWVAAFQIIFRLFVLVVHTLKCM